MSFFQDFIASGSDFNRKITDVEYDQKFLGFPHSNISNIGYLGPGYIKPTIDNCYKYHCFPVTAVLLYNASGIKVAKFEIVQNDFELVETIWNKCNSDAYKCVPLQHFGATYNCIGWSMGITKWLEPAEITAQIQLGKSKAEAIEVFIKNKITKFPENHPSNIENLLNKFDHNVVNMIQNNTVAFYFNDKGECLHGSRYIDSIDNQAVGKWTSKLGSDILISHENEDLVGYNSIYGTQLYYVGLISNNSKEIDINNEL